MSTRLLIIAAGGTGGHMFPAQALAEEMLGRGWRVQLSTDARGLRFADGFPDVVERVELRSATFSRGGLLAKLKAPFEIWAGARAARARFRAERPACVIGFGGYPSLPALMAAGRLGIPRLIHEQNGVLGRVNRLFAPRVDRVACGTWPVTNAPASARLVQIGNPVRHAVLKVRDVAYERPGAGEITLLVFGGSQGASAFARLVPEAIALLEPELRGRLRLTQQVRPGEEDAVARAYQAAGVSAELATFFADMPDRIAKAQLVISRAGASTVAELAAIGRPSILIPYPAATDDHQTANARSLSGQGAALTVQEGDLTPAKLSALITEICEKPAEAARMAANARKAGRPRAASELADLVEMLGKPGGA